jgi:hypothetical protein
MPWISGSADRPLITATSSAVVVSSGSPTCREAMPAFRDRFSFIRTYITDAGSSPTITVARPGVVPAAVSLAARSVVWLTSSAASFDPSIRSAGMFPLVRLVRPGRVRRGRVLAR